MAVAKETRPAIDGVGRTIEWSGETRFVQEEEKKEMGRSTTKKKVRAEGERKTKRGQERDTDW